MKIFLRENMGTAIQVWQEVGFNYDKPVSKTYDGYVAQFGASLVNIGLIPTLIHFEKKTANTNSKEDRTKIVSALLKVMKIIYSGEENEGLKKVTKLSDHFIGNTDKIEQWLPKITRCIILLKIALRTFNLQKDDDE